MKKNILIFAFLASIIAVRAQDIVVTDVKVTFFVPAHTEDKDLDTKVSATMYTASGKPVARLDQCCGNIRFSDSDFQSSTYQLTMRNEIKKSEVQSGYFTIHIDPKGNDRWIFTPTFEIFFSDATSVIIKGEGPDLTYRPRIVSEQAPDTSFPFHL